MLCKPTLYNFESSTLVIRHMCKTMLCKTWYYLALYLSKHIRVLNLAKSRNCHKACTVFQFKGNMLVLDLPVSTV